MVKSYFKYEHSSTFGLIASASANVAWAADEISHGSTSLSRTTGAGRAITAADEDVLCWDIKKSELLGRWRDGKCDAQATVIVRSGADPDIYAVGYADGSIRIWDSRLSTVIIRFNGHKTAVTTLAFDAAGVRLGSGSQDTDIIVWDLVAETGLFKLRGHKNQVTGLEFLQVGTDRSGETNGQTNGDAHVEDTEQLPGVIKQGEVTEYLLSTSKDALIKLWDLDSQHCIETHVAQSNGECWALGLSPGGDGCITAGNDGELRIWTIDKQGLRKSSFQAIDSSTTRHLFERGTINRNGKDRTLGVKFHPRLGYIAAHGLDKSIELWRIRSASEVQKTMARKRKRRREKTVHDSADGPDHDEEKELEDIASADINDVIVPHVIIRTTGKVRSIQWAGFQKNKSMQLLAATTNNQLETYVVTLRKSDKKSKADEPPEYDRKFAIDLPGHRTDIRSLSLSSDDRMLASASNGSLKIWNVKTQSCIRTLECGYALCSSFLPGDKIVVIGTRNGEVEVFDISSSTLIETVKAHEGPVWTLHVHPDGKSMVTGSADKTAKFWKFEIVQEEIPGTRRTTPRLQLVHKRTLQLSDDVLSIRFSPDARLLAVSLLDNTVKVFFVDSLKLFLNLYGHKLPVLNMDISYDSRLIVTCSADKNIRVWGLDFGDCHKAFFGHQDSVMQVAFVPHNQDGNGHHFFSASKDRIIKYWDGDKFEQIQKLAGHHGEIWAIAVSRTGEFLASASHDKSIRIWQQTDEQIFLEEEREKELEELYENTLTTSLEQQEEDGAEGEEGGKAETIAGAGKQTVETLMAGEKIAEALDIGIEDLALVAEWQRQKAAMAPQSSLAPPQRNLNFVAAGNVSAEQYVLGVLSKIPAAALQDALLVLPFSKCEALFAFIRVWAERPQWNLPLTCRVLFFMLKTHHRQLVASKTMRVMLEDIRGKLRGALQGAKDEMGYNLAGLKVLGARVNERDVGRGYYVDEEAWEEREKSEKADKKRAFVNVA